MRGSERNPIALLLPHAVITHTQGFVYHRRHAGRADRGDMGGGAGVATGDGGVNWIAPPIPWLGARATSSAPSGIAASPRK